LKLLITDSCGISDTEYAEISADLLEEFKKPEVHPVSICQPIIDTG
jgi:hypothetical protein